MTHMRPHRVKLDIFYMEFSFTFGSCRGRRFLPGETSSPNSHAARGALPRSVVRTNGSTKGRRHSEERVSFPGHRPATATPARLSCECSPPARGD